MADLALRPSMLPYLLYQRTQYACDLNKFARRYLRPMRLYRPWRILLEPRIERLFINQAAKKYEDDLAREFAQLEPLLPPLPCTFLDIGCGLGGIDVLLHRHYNGHAKIHLLDKDGISKIYYGFEPEAAFYNNAGLTLTFMADNGVPSSAVTFHNSDGDGFPKNIKFDLILSLISWGFHYPVDTYLESAAHTLSPHGRIILDVRQGTGGEEQLKKYFKIMAIEENSKRKRIVAIKDSPSNSRDGG